MRARHPPATRPAAPRRAATEADVTAYGERFDAICNAIAASIVGIEDDDIAA